MASDAVAAESAEAQLARIASSPQFEDSKRLVEFLRYVVTEALAGREHQLTGRAVGQAVFGRGPDFDPQHDAIVRVEAGRLRRRLSLYYAATGAGDPLRITIPKGGYVPTFELVAAPAGMSSTSATGVTSRSQSRVVLGVAGVVVLLAMAFGGYALIRDPGSGTTADARRFTANSEAHALFVESLSISWPPTNRQRVEAALDLAREVARLDADFAGGYAAEAKLLWRYIMFGHSEAPAEDAARALELAETAISLQPEFGWGYQALSRARHLTGDLDGAVAAARQAADLQPMDAESQGNLGLILLITGRPEEAIAPLREAIRLAGDNPRAPYWNLLAMAQFHAGSADQAITTLENNRAQGGPMGPHVQFYLAAAYAELGRFADARVALVRVQNAAQVFSVEEWLERLLVDDAQRQQVYAALEPVGFTVGEN